MRYSRILTKTRKNPPADEVTINAKLLIRAGFINKLMAGVYSYLPLGLRVLRNIEQVIREEMEAIGGQEVLLPGLQPAENWKRTGGWENIDVLFKVKSRTGRDYALGQSHEEVVTPLVKEYVQSYKDLPVFLYQIQNKYRDELRAKSGILRGREFGMKDMYSFHLDENDFQRFYELVKKAYLKIYKRCGLEVKVTEASGGSFSKKISYEFMVLTSAGEDDIFYCNKCNYCVNAEIAKVKKGDKCPLCGKGELDKARASEVGNVFDLGQKYAKDFDFHVLNEKGEKIYPTMGCYGIGTTRLMGTIVEKYSDQKGIVWPSSVAPFQVYLLGVEVNDKIRKLAENAYKYLENKGVSVLFDDRENVSPGEKFADADLIGIPVRLLISEKTGEKIEWSERATGKKEILSLRGAIKKLSASPFDLGEF